MLLRFADAIDSSHSLLLGQRRIFVPTATFPVVLVRVFWFEYGALLTFLFGWWSRLLKCVNVVDACLRLQLVLDRGCIL